jgi:hypothetical protein
LKEGTKNLSSGYVVAGFEVLTTIIDNFIFSPYFDNNFSRQDLINFFETKCNKFLHCIGADFKGKKRYDKFIKKKISLLNYCRNSEFYGNSEFFLDSGGFQLSIGVLNKDESLNLQNLYYDFLNQYHSKYDRAFIFDMPPGGGCTVFKTFKDVYDENKKSYLKAAEFPQNIRDKIIYIHHFRTPKLWEIYTKILDENDLFDKFKYHGTGGIVANLSTDLAIPCIIYVLPLIPLLSRAIKSKRTFLNFHVLGGAGFRDILFYEMFRIHIMEKYNIELNITYDSSGIFKALMIAKFIHIIKDNSVFKINIGTPNLDMRHKNFNFKIIDLFREGLNKFSIDNNFKKLSFDSPYDPKTGTFYENVRLYSMLCVLNNYSDMTIYFRNIVGELYDLYKNKLYAEFNEKIELITRRINGNKITKKQTSKSSSLINSLDMLTNLDENYAKYLVDKFLSKDEFLNLQKNKLYTI